LSIRKTILAAGGLALAAALGLGAGAAQATTQTCNDCVHVQNDYAFRGALDALHQATAVNSPIGLWYEQASTTDAGADLLAVSSQTVVPSATPTNDGTVNQSNLNWYPYEGDTVVRFKYDPFGNGGANTYMGLNGAKVALRNDNPDSVWQSFIEVPVTKAGLPDGSGPTSADLGGVANACGPLNPASHGSAYCVLIDVGQTQNADDPMVVTDPGDSDTGSMVQQDVEFASINQNSGYATNQVWDFQP
jgi:hypothetical protein